MLFIRRFVKDETSCVMLTAMRSYALLALACSTLACQRHQDAGTSAAASSATTENGMANPKVELGLTLIDPGAEPRQTLRYHLTKGSTRSFEMSVEVDLDNPGIHGAMPTIRMDGDLSIDDISPDGDMTMTMVMHDIKASERPGSPITGEMMQKYLGALEGFTIHGKLSPLGTMTGVNVDAKNVPKTVLDQLGPMTKNLKQLALPLPDKPIGAGARWDLVNSLEQGGLRVTTTTHVTLTKLAGDVIGFHTAIDISAQPQTIEQPGMTVHIDKVSGGGSGDGTIDLASFTLSGTQSTGFRADLTMGSDREASIQHTSTTVTPLQR
jgi:hypothetical protein